MKKLYFLLVALMAIASGAQADGNVAGGHEFVDLGLPSGTLWATCNVGANSREEVGDYFAWGETKPKARFNWSTYQYCDGTEDVMTKYNETDGELELLPEDDAANVNWGEGWYMPSREQINELLNDKYTMRGMYNLNGVDVMFVKSLINDKEIFLPRAGYRNENGLCGSGDVVSYWSRTVVNGNKNKMAYTIDSYYIHSFRRYYGCCVRPVRTTLPMEAYAELTSDSTLWFHYDNQRKSREGIIYELKPAVSPYPNWKGDASKVSRVEFDQSFAEVRPTNTYQWFGQMENLKAIIGLSNLNTSEVTNMGEMFGGCKKLTSLNLRGFNTSKVKNMYGMFYGCTSLTALNLSSFNTSKVLYMDYMFYMCKSLKDLDIRSFDTSDVVRMTAMFSGCQVLTNLDMDKLNTSKVTDMKYMFASCFNLTKLDLCSFNTANVTDMSGMFRTCYGLKTIYVGDGWNTYNVTSSDEMFYECTLLVGAKGTTYDPNNVGVSYARIDGGPARPGYLTYLHKYDFQYGGIYYLDMGGRCSAAVTYKDASYDTYRGDVIIPEEVENSKNGMLYTVSQIADRAFYRCPSLKSVTIPATVDLIDNDAFLDSFIEFPTESSITCLAKRPPTVSPTAFGSDIADMTLYVRKGCKAAYEAAAHWKDFGNIVELPYHFQVGTIYYAITGENTVSVVNRDANYYTYWSQVTIPATVTYEDVTYTVTKIDNLAFFRCPELIRVIMPSTITSIGNRSFKDCTRLTSITIPENVTRIGVYAFDGCTALNEITCLATEPPSIDYTTFTESCYQGASLYVPYGCHDTYMFAPVWEQFYDIFELPDGLDEISATIENGDIYNLAGQRLQKMQKGINIVGGKKVAIK
jgi:surface protein